MNIYVYVASLHKDGKIPLVIFDFWNIYFGFRESIFCIENSAVSDVSVSVLCLRSESTFNMFTFNIYCVVGRALND